MYEKEKSRRDKIKILKSDLNKIEKLAGFGFTQKQICEVLGFSVDTLRRRLFGGDIDLSAVITKGKTEAISKVAAKAYSLAIAGNTSMIKYFLNCQGGWSEKQQITIDSKKMESEDSQSFMDSELEEIMSHLNMEELEQYEKIAAEAQRLNKLAKDRMSQT